MVEPLFASLLPVLHRGGSALRHDTPDNLLFPPTPGGVWATIASVLCLGLAKIMEALMMARCSELYERLVVMGRKRGDK